MPASLSFNQIKAEVAALDRKRTVESPVGIRAGSRWLGEPRQADGETGYLIQQCDSPLAMRRALRQPSESEGRRVLRVIVTSLPDAEISGDIFSRLHRQRLFSIDRWSLVQQMFAADAIDPQLAEHDWLADAAIEVLAGRSLAAVKSGCLGADTLWRELLAAAIGLTVDLPDLQSLLRWSLDAANLRRFRALPDQLREAMQEWIASRAGDATHFVFAVVSRTDEPLAVPLALVAAALTGQGAEGRGELSLTRLEERYLTRRPWPSDLLSRVGREAVSLVRVGFIDPVAKQRLLLRSEALLGELDALTLAHTSAILPIGLEQRLADFAAAITTFTAAEDADIKPVVDAADRVKSHDLMQAGGSESERLEMALRLVRWLAWRRGNRAEPQSLGEAATVSLAVGSFVDWARDTIGSVAESRALAAAVAALHTRVTQEQEADAEAFGKLLHNAVATDSYSAPVLGVEEVLDAVVTPLAREKPVLLIVLDGMSVAVCRELVASLMATNEWRPLVEEGLADWRPVLATIPSETHVSRASLLAGRLTSGGDEAASFAGHSGLLAISNARQPPVLYAKSDLGSKDLPDPIRDEIATEGRRVVGVIINAVDDHLAKANQLSVRWTPKTIPLLSALLTEARAGKRAVVLTSDHGHVLERGTQARRVNAGGGSRWRPVDDAEPAADEWVFQGRRVLAPGGQLVTTWSERVRYMAPTSRGYHGGVNPQEMLVPLAVLVPTADTTEPPGWQAAPEATPAWWDESGLRVAPPRAPAEPPAPPVAPPKGMLFDPEQLHEPAEPTPAEAQAADADGGAVPAWIDQLFASDVFDSQRKLLTRGYAGDEVYRRLLAALDARGGRMTKPALARAIEYPPFRMGGLLSRARQLFNIDGYPVVTVDTESDTVILEKPTLLVQFGLE